MDVSSPGELAATEPDPRAIAAERLTFFADAVIAIAITLLALELPDLPETEGTGNLDLLRAVSAERGVFIAFLISFYVIGMHWSSHHRVFRYVTRLGGRLSVISMLWLLMQVITPYATKVLSGDGAFQFRFVLYAGVQALSGLFFVLMVREIQAHHLYRADTPKELFRNAYFGSGSLAAGFLLSIPLSFVSQTLAYDAWIVVPVGTAVIRRIRKRRLR
jgi:TMEM175 potassium channel family protein